MTGKVFAESSDIYEDQARVLFEYYRRAAEKIVAEEMGLERAIEEAERERDEAAATVEGESRTFKVLCVAALAAFVALTFVHPLAGLAGGAVLGVLAFLRHGEAAKAASSVGRATERIEDLRRQKDEIRRDYRVRRIGVAYVPVAERVSSDGRSYLVDITGEQEPTEFSLTLINRPDELRDAMGDIRERIQELPSVESSEDAETVDTSDYSASVQDVTLHDYMGAIDRQLRNVGYLVSDNRSVSVELPVIEPGSERYRALEEYATTDAGGHPVLDVFDDAEVMDRAREFSSLSALNVESSADGSGDVDFFVDVMRQLAQGVDTLSRSRASSVTQLVGYGSQILRNVLKASFDQYSPLLEAAEIERMSQETFDYQESAAQYVPFSMKESSRVRYDIFSDAWIAENGMRTAQPFGVSQIDAEVLMPVISNLMGENRTERMRIYAEIQSQKTDYLNQWHRDTDDFFGRNRSEANALLQRMNETYASYVESYVNYQQQKSAFESMKATGSIDDAQVQEATNQATMIEGFQIQMSEARAKQQEFQEFMDRIRDDIDESAVRFGRVEYFEASLRDRQARDSARAQEALGELDARRLRLATVSAYLAQAADVPPEPSVSERLDEDFAMSLSAQAEGQISRISPSGVGAEGVDG